MPPKLKVPAYTDPVKRWNFRKDGSAFAFSQVNPLRDCHLRTHQTLRGHTRIFARTYLRPSNLSHVATGRTMCYAGTKSVRPSIAPLPEPQWGLTLIELLRPYYLGSGRRIWSDGRKLSIPSTSRTLAARRREPSTNLLDGLEAPFASALSRQTPSPQLVKNRAHKTGNRKSTRLVNKELADLWKIPTPEGHSISEPFKPEDLAAALRRLKPGKSPGLDSIFPGFILHAESALKSWFCDFLSSCMRHLKISKIWRRALVVAIPKPEKPLGTKRVTVPDLCCVSPLKSSRDSSMLVSTQS